MKDISDILKKCFPYEYFLIDVWGVIHDGGLAFEHAKMLLCTLKEQGKKVALFSNSARRSSIVKEYLSNIGLPESYYTNLITSGDMFFRDLKNREDNHFSHLEGPFAFIDNSFDETFFSSLNLPVTHKYEEGKTLILFAVDHLSEEELEKLNHHIMNHKPVILCPNGDNFVMSNSIKVLCPGTLARQYQDQRVETYIYGKPSYRFFYYAYKTFEAPGKQDFLVIGDTLETDIVGALRFGLDGLLVKSGLDGVEGHYRAE